MSSPPKCNILSRGSVASLKTKETFGIDPITEWLNNSVLNSSHVPTPWKPDGVPSPITPHELAMQRLRAKRDSESEAPEPRNVVRKEEEGDTLGKGIWDIRDGVTWPGAELN